MPTIDFSQLNQDQRQKILQHLEARPEMLRRAEGVRNIFTQKRKRRRQEPMMFDVDLKIKDVDTGIGTDVTIRLDVKQAESGLYIASCSSQSPLIVAGKTPRLAILEYLSCLFDSKTIEPA
jgi:hypothetical protein